MENLEGGAGDSEQGCSAGEPEFLLVSEGSC